MEDDEASYTDNTTRNRSKYISAVHLMLTMISLYRRRASTTHTVRAVSTVQGCPLAFTGDENEGNSVEDDVEVEEEKKRMRMRWEKWRFSIQILVPDHTSKPSNADYQLTRLAIAI